jgi:hypothetical protein
MNPLDAIRTALEALCLRAAVSPDDGGPVAASAVRALLARDRHPITVVNLSDPVGCGFVSWLSAATGIPLATADGTDPGEPSILATTSKVLYQGRRATDGTRERVCVPLPRCVAAALGAKVNRGGRKKREAA